MRNVAGLSFFIAGLALAGMATVRAADTQPANSTGTIAGRVVDSEGKPVPGARVVVYAPEKSGESKGGGGKEYPHAVPKREPVARAESGADGTFTLTDVPVGKVRVIAGLKGTGLGLLREPALVKAGETVKVGDIELKKHEENSMKPNDGKKK